MKQFYKSAVVVFLFLSLISVTVYSQSGNKFKVQGVVYDEKGEPLTGATVYEKGGTNGVITSFDGSYELTVSTPIRTIIFSFIGYVTQELDVNSKSKLDVHMKLDNTALDEVVLVGYQTMRKSDLTGAIASVKSKELNLSAPSVGQTLVGKVAGVQISQVSGAPYENTKIRVRGVASINASSDPLYVIDGYPSTTDIAINPEDIESIEILKDAASAAIYGSRAAGGVVLITTKRGRDGSAKVSFNYQFGVNQLSHKVKLLDANGFTQLMVDGRNNTYKDLVLARGKTWDDAMYSDINTVRIANTGGANNSAVSIPDNMYDFPNQKIIPSQYNTDWQDELYRNALSSRYNFAVSGGNKDVRYQLSVGYQDNQGIIVTTGQKRLNMRANIDVDVTERFSMGTNLSLNNNWNDEVDEGRWDKSPILAALVYAPVFKAYNADGTLSKNEMASYSTYGLQTTENPVALASETKISKIEANHTYNIFGVYKLTDYLQAKVSLGLTDYYEKYEYYKPTSLSSGIYPPYSDEAKAAAYATAMNELKNDYLGEFTLNFNKSFGKSNVNGVLGYSMERNLKDVVSVKASGFQDDYIQEITAHGADPSFLTLNSTTLKSNWSMLSYFSRVNYSYDSKYFLSASLRGDGCSVFGPLNRWGYFPSVSGGWTVSEEDFYKNNLGEESTLKLRASWGLSGNNSIGNYKYLRTLAPPSGVVFGSGTITSSIYPSSFKDPNLGWESTSQYNIGTDIGLMKGRVNFAINYYLSHTFNLLFNQSISAVSGTTSVLTNLPNSKIQNQGFDFQVDTRVISKKDFDLGLSANISFNRNKVLDLGGGGTIITNGAERSYMTHITQEGSPIGMFYGFKVAGMVQESDMANIAADDKVYNAGTHSFPDGYKIKGPPRSIASSTPLQPGDLYFEDVTGNGIVDDNDKGIIGSPYPDFTYGFAITSRYKAFDLQASFNGSYGNQVLDGQDYYIYNMEGSGNQYADVADRYVSASQPGNGSVYRASRGGTQSNSTRLSTFYLQDASFLRCTDLTIGYKMDAIGRLTNNNISSLRIYCSANNLFTLTKYKGYNPEVDYNNGSNLTPGVDYGKYPLVRSYNLGIQLVF